MTKSTVNPLDKATLFDTNYTKIVKKLLLVLIGYFILMTVLEHGFIFGIQHVINVIIIVFAVRESEILFYSHRDNANRDEAKKLVDENQSLITSLSIALFIPYFTPIVISIIVSVLAVFVMKSLFGGYVHRIFSPVLFAILLLSVGFRISLNSVIIPNTFDNQLFIALGNTNLFQNIFNFSVNFDTTNTLQILILNGTFIFIMMFIVLTITNIKKMLFPVLVFGFFIVFYLVFSNQVDFLKDIFQTEFLFIIVFILTDTLLTAYSTQSKIVVSVLIGVSAVILITLNQSHMMVYAVLLGQLVTPLFNQNVWFTPNEKQKALQGPTITRYVLNFFVFVIVLAVGIQMSWLYFGPMIGKPKFDVLQYFELYNSGNYTQNLVSTRDYNPDDYESIQDVYEVVNNETEQIEVLMYNMITDGFWGPINVIVVVDPYTDTIVNYYVVRHEEVQGAAYFDDETVQSVIGLSVLNFNIDEDLNAGATGTYNAMQSIVSDVLNNYVNEEVSLHEEVN